MSKKEILIKQYNEKLNQNPNTQIILFVTAAEIDCGELSQETDCVIIKNQEELEEFLMVFNNDLYLIPQDSDNIIGCINYMYFATDVEEV